jgi:hypothetical protein
MACCQFHGGQRDENGLVFCGAKTEPGKSYCDAHHYRVYHRVRPEIDRELQPERAGQFLLVRKQRE